MNRSAFVALGLAGALALVAAPASAQHHRNGGGGSRDNAQAPRTEQRAERSQPQAQPQPQPQAPRQQSEQRAVPRGEYRLQERRDVRPDVRPEYRAIPRDEYNRRTPQYSSPRYAPRYDNRYDNRRYDGGRYYGGGYSGRYYGPRYSGPRFSIAPRRFYRPYYVFRPRFSLGFGVWLGYPVTYYQPYYYPYDSSPYDSYPYSSGGVYVTPNQTNMGGISFDISPDDAEIWVDGNYMGEVHDFTPSSQPLGLPAGRHRIELRAPGYEVGSFDVDIVPGQVLPFQGQLQ